MLEYHLKMEKELEEELKYLEKQWNNAGVASKGDIENEIENVERKLHKRKQKIALVEAAKPPEEVHIEIFVLTALKAQILENLDEELANILPQERNGETLYQDWQPYLAESKNIEELFLDFKVKQGYNFTTTYIEKEFSNDLIVRIDECIRNRIQLW